MNRPGWLRTIRFLAAPLVALILAAMSATLSFGLMGALDSYEPALPFDRIVADADAAVPPASLASTRTARRVLLVVVDGLRLDTSLSMSSLNELRQRGTYGQMTVSQPSYSKPGYAAIATGATQEVTGVVLNAHAGLTPAETIFTVAAKGGLRTSAIADEWWGELCGSAVTYQHYYPDSTFDDPATDERTAVAAAASITGEGADLTLVHFAATDTQAHETGGAASAEYQQAASRVDFFISNLVSQLDLSRDAIIVTADHGHLSRNMGPGSGHGGWEPDVITVPLVAAGAGIAKGGLSGHELSGQVPAVDLTPTVAALLGLPAPAGSEGRIIFPMLAATAQQKATLAVARARRLSVLAPAYTAMFRSGTEQPDADLTAATSALSAGDCDTAFARSEASVGHNQAVMAAARQSAVARGRTARVPLAVLELLALAATFCGAARLAGRGRWWVPLACGAAYLTLDFAVYRGIMHGTYSLGALTGSDISSMLRLFAIPAYVAAVLVVAAVVSLFRAPTRSDRVALVEAALVGCLGAGFAIAIYGLWANGTVFQPLLPDFRVAFLTLTYLLKGTFLALLFVLLPTVAALWPVKPKQGTSEPAVPVGRN